MCWPIVREWFMASWWVVSRPEDPDNEYGRWEYKIKKAQSSKKALFDKHRDFVIVSGPYATKKEAEKNKPLK